MVESLTGNQTLKEISQEAGPFAVLVTVCYRFCRFIGLVDLMHRKITKLENSNNKTPEKSANESSNKKVE